MGTNFCYLPLIKYNDLIGILDRAKSVRDDNDRSTPEKFIEVVDDDPFIFGIQGIGGFIQEDEIWRFVNGSGDQQALTAVLG